MQTVKQNKQHTEKHLNIHYTKEKMKHVCNPEFFPRVFITCSSLFRRVHKNKATLEHMVRKLLLGEALLLFKGAKSKQTTHTRHICATP